MKIGELVAALPRDRTRVLIEFPDIGGPYYTPGDFKWISMTEPEAIAIQADFPRADIAAYDLVQALLFHDQGGEVQLYLPGPPQMWFNIKGLRPHAKTDPSRGIVIVAGGLIST